MEHTFCIMRFATTGFEKDPEYKRLMAALGDAKIKLVNFYNDMVDFHLVPTTTHDGKRVLQFDTSTIEENEEYRRLVAAFTAAKLAAINYLNEHMEFFTPRFEN